MQSKIVIKLLQNLNMIVELCLHGLQTVICRETMNSSRLLGPEHRKWFADLLCLILSSNTKVINR